MSETSRGMERELALDLESYFSGEYVELNQLCSFVHQIEHIMRLKPRSVVEIGIGNGFVSTFLKRSGVKVTTVDINESLKPDLCMPLSEAPAAIAEKVDLVVCCEVLEHMPENEIEANLGYLKSMGHNLFLTLPNANRSFGFGGLVKLPFIGTKVVDLNMDIPIKHKLEGGPHFWEVGSHGSVSRKSIVQRLQKHYTKIRSGRFAMNPYHIWFVGT